MPRQLDSSREERGAVSGQASITLVVVSVLAGILFGGWLAVRRHLRAAVLFGLAITSAVLAVLAGLGVIALSFAFGDGAIAPIPLWVSWLIGAVLVLALSVAGLCVASAVAAVLVVVRRAFARSTVRP
jgi:hypothetical protein